MFYLLEVVNKLFVVPGRELSMEIRKIVGYDILFVNNSGMCNQNIAKTLRKVTPKCWRVRDDLNYLECCNFVCYGYMNGSEVEFCSGKFMSYLRQDDVSNGNINFVCYEVQDIDDVVSSKYLKLHIEMEKGNNAKLSVEDNNG